jgi:hypothetical protein
VVSRGISSAQDQDTEWTRIRGRGGSKQGFVSSGPAQPSPLQFVQRSSPPSRQLPSGREERTRANVLDSASEYGNGAQPCISPGLICYLIPSPSRFVSVSGSVSLLLNNLFQRSVYTCASFQELTLRHCHCHRHSPGDRCNPTVAPLLTSRCRCRCCRRCRSLARLLLPLFPDHEL